MGWAGLGWAGAGLQSAVMGRAESFCALRPRPSGLWGRSQQGLQVDGGDDYGV